MFKYKTALSIIGLLAISCISFSFYLPNILEQGVSNDASTNALDTSPEARADSLLALMTLREKLGQLQQLDGGLSKNDLPTLIKEGKVGSVLNEVDTDLLEKYQRIALEESRHGIPLLIGRDVVHGFRTIFPIPLAQSATWNPRLVEEGARIAAVESKAVGINWTFAPMIDVARDPRWGRIAESPGEDPYLASIMGVANIRGFQGKNLSDSGSMAACVKHFAAYGMSEGGRDYNSANVGERHLREVYLRPFAAAVEADAASFMTSFNEINDVPATGNEFLLRGILKGEWNYDGMVVSDWESVKEMIAHGYCADEKAAALSAMRAGVDMEMTSTCMVDNLPALLTEKKIKLSQIDDAVKRILVLKYRLGLFENPYPRRELQAQVLSEDNLKAALRTAEQSMVLLKNENAILPLKDDLKSMAVIGPMADAPYEQLGTWIFDGKEKDSVTPLNALKKALADKTEVNYAQGLKISRTKTREGFPAAIAAAEKSDIVLFFVGEEAILSGEAHSRAHLNLPGIQEELLAELGKTGKPIVMIVMAGRPLILTDLLPQVSAVLYAWHPGTMAGPAITNLLTGKVNPSGKLPVTFPRAVGQIPVYHAHKNTGRPANADNWVHIDDIPVKAWQTSLGNTSHYLDVGFTPLFPFGFGLSYTDFTYGDLQLDQTKMQKNGRIIASVKVTNTGEVIGREIVQLYIRDKFGSVTRPVRELKGFEEFTLKPGESTTVLFEITEEKLAFFNADMKLSAEAGEFTLWIGGHAATSSSVDFVCE